MLISINNEVNIKLAKAEITKAVYDMALPLAQQVGLCIYEVEYKKEGSDNVLRVILDTLPDGGEKSIGINDCETVSRALSEELDKNDIISQAYMLEVTSPGLDRPLKKDEDYVRFKGKKIDIGLYKAVDGSKIITGELVGLEDNKISIIKDGDSTPTEIEKDKTAWVKLAVVF